MIVCPNCGQPAASGMSAAAEIARITAETVDRIERNRNRANLVAMYGAARVLAAELRGLMIQPPRPSEESGGQDATTTERTAI